MVLTLGGALHSWCEGTVIYVSGIPRQMISNAPLTSMAAITYGVLFPSSETPPCLL